MSDAMRGRHRMAGFPHMQLGRFLTALVRAGLLVALMLFALAVCAAIPVPAVVRAGMIVSAAGVTSYPSVQTACADCVVAARSAGDTARRGWIEDEGCADGGMVSAVGAGAIVPDLRAVGVVGPPGVDSLTVVRVV